MPVKPRKSVTTILDLQNIFLELFIALHYLRPDGNPVKDRKVLSRQNQCRLLKMNRKGLSRQKSTGMGQEYLELLHFLRQQIGTT